MAKIQSTVNTVYTICIIIRSNYQCRWSLTWQRYQVWNKKAEISGGRKERVFACDKSSHIWGEVCSFGSKGQLFVNT